MRKALTWTDKFKHSSMSLLTVLNKLVLQPCTVSSQDCQDARVKTLSRFSAALGSWALRSADSQPPSSAAKKILPCTSPPAVLVVCYEDAAKAKQRYSASSCFETRCRLVPSNVTRHALAQQSTKLHSIGATKRS